MSRAQITHVRIATVFVAALLSIAGMLSTVDTARTANIGDDLLGSPACTTSAQWSFQTAQAFLPAALSGAPYGLDLVFVSSGTAFYAFWAEDLAGPGGHTAGDIAWQVNAPQGVVFQNDPVIADLSFGGGVVVFSTTNEGRVICLDAETGTILWLSLRVRRPTCSDDTIIASPVVQLWDFSNAAFKAAIPDDDLVLVVTRYECGTTTENRVYALNASDGTTRWVFNNPQIADMDYGAEGCAVDYATNTIFCGTNLPVANPAQHTVWAIDTRNAGLKWSVNAGSILSRPQVRSDRVYVGNTDGLLLARNAISGAPLWSLDLTPAVPVGITRDVWAELRAPFADRVLAVDAGGALHAVVDDGVTIPVAPLWSTDPGLSVSSLGAVAPTLGKLYVGMSDGTIHQLSYSTGISENSTLVKAGAPVSMGALDSAQAAALPNRLNTAAGGRERRYCIPWGGFVDVEPGPAAAVRGLSLESAPNPFVGTTRLSYRLASAAAVRLTVHDARGRRVRTIEDGARAAGPHAADWDGKDEAGTRVPAGVYFARLAIEDGAEAERADRVLIVVR